MTLHKACHRDHRSRRLTQGCLTLTEPRSDWALICAVDWKYCISSFTELFLVCEHFLVQLNCHFWPFVSAWTTFCKYYAFLIKGWKEKLNGNICVCRCVCSTHHSLDCSVGESFCAMWYKALMAFMLNKGGLRSAEISKDGRVRDRWRRVMLQCQSFHNQKSASP